MQQANAATTTKRRNRVRCRISVCAFHLIDFFYQISNLISSGGLKLMFLLCKAERYMRYTYGVYARLYPSSRGVDRAYGHTLSTSECALTSDEDIIETIDVNHVNVNTFYFYFTPIMAENDVKHIFYILPLRSRLCGELRSFSCSCSQKCYFFIGPTFRFY